MSLALLITLVPVPDLCLAGFCLTAMSLAALFYARPVAKVQYRLSPCFALLPARYPDRWLTGAKDMTEICQGYEREKGEI
jgi:hypothetical protein